LKRLAALLVALPAVAFAAPATLDEILTGLEAAQKRTPGLTGEFTQRNKLKLFKQELKSKGRFTFRAPRKIRWEYLDPDPSLLVLENETATLTTPGSAPQVFDLSKDATMRSVFDQLLLFTGAGGGGAIGKAKNDYALAASGTAEAPVLSLTPLPTSPVAKAFQRIELRLDPKTWLIRSILLVEKSGDEKEIAFTKLSVDKS
jgi:outer membrane lipoprotein-sorting protein